MSSPQQTRAWRVLKNLSEKISYLRCVFRTLTQAAGWWSGGDVYAELLSRVRAGNNYTLTFLSIPGRRYIIHQSLDMIHWSVAAAEVQAAAEPDVVTTWISPPVAAGVEVYYRILLLPQEEFHCYTQAADGRPPLAARCLFTDDLVTLS